MINAIPNTLENDPLTIPEKKAVIDQILTDNRDRPGAAMVVLNEIQNQIGFITEKMQAYVAKSLDMPVGCNPRRRHLLFLLYNKTARSAHD